jgi:hypothetical protein
MQITNTLTARQHMTSHNTMNKLLQKFRLTVSSLIVITMACAGLLSATPAAAGAGTYRLNRGESLYGGQSLVSTNRQNWVTMQPDGNLVIWAEGNGVSPWTTNTGGHSGAYAVMQTDGNFVIYTSNGQQALWQSHTYGSNPGSYVSMNGDGNLVVYNSSNNPLWWTGTTSTWHVGPVRQMTESYGKASEVTQARFQWNYHNVYIWGSTSCNKVSDGYPDYVSVSWCGTAGNGSNQSMNAGMNVTFNDIFTPYTFSKWDRMNTDINGNYWTSSGYLN